MPVATSSTSVGVRELKNNLSRYLHKVAAGERVVVTDRGRPVARLVGLGPEPDPLADLIAAGIVTPARRPKGPLPKRIRAAGTVSDLVAEQRR